MDTSVSRVARKWSKKLSAEVITLALKKNQRAASLWAPAPLTSVRASTLMKMPFLISKTFLNLYVL